MRRRRWTPEEDRLLRQMYGANTTDKIAERLGRERYSVYNRATALGLKKSRDQIADCTRRRWAEGLHEGSRRAHFAKGQTPHNKGLRRPGWAPGRMAETQFKKGSMHGAAQHNYVPIGTEKIEPKRNVLLRKVTDDPTIFPVQRWRPVHVIVWEAANGPVPDGHMVVFRRGLKTFKASEITIDRLDLVTRAENMRRNTIHNYPPATKEAMRLVGRVKRQARKREEQD